MSERIYRAKYETSEAKLYLAFELGSQEWKLGFTIGLGQSPRRRTVSARDLTGCKKRTIINPKN